MKKNSQKIEFSNQKGFSLIITLLVMSVVLVISLAVSGLMIAETKLVGNYDDSLIALSAANAGVENALLMLKEGKPLPSEFNLDLGNNITAQVQSSQTSDLMPGSLVQDQSVEINLTNDNRPDIVEIWWNNTGTKNSAVEWTLITYKNDFMIPYGNIDKGFYSGNGVRASYNDSSNNKPSSAFFTSSSLSLTESGGYPNKITINLLTDKAFLYKLRFKCLANTNPGFTGGSYSLNYKITGGGQMGTGSYVISSTGNSNEVKRKVIVRTDAGESGTHGIFDYVLYSEDILYKP